MKKKLLLISCIAALAMSMTACGSDSSSSSKSASSEATLSVSDSASDSTSDSASDSAAESGETSDISGGEDKAPEIDIDDEGESGASVDLTVDSKAVDILKEVSKKVSESKNFSMTGVANADFSMSMDGQTVDAKMNMDVKLDSTEKGMHYTQTSVTSQTGSDEKTESSEGYVDADGNAYESTDGGKTWNKGASSINLESITDNVFSGENLTTAEVTEDGDNYVITTTAAGMKGFGDVAGLDGLSDNVDLSGSIVITVTKDYYPVSIELKDFGIGTQAATDETVDEPADDGSADSSADESAIAGDINMSMNMTVTYSNWGEVSDDKVAIPDGVKAK